MKDFGKYVLATVVGIFATGIIMGVLFLMSIVGIVASGEATTNLKDNTVMVLNLSGSIEEQQHDSPFAALLGDELGSTGLNEILSAVKKAKENDEVKGIYIEAGMLSTGYATLYEIRQALLDFKKSGKWIIAYGDTYSQASYYLASVADKVYLNPSGSVDLHGIASQVMFVKDLYAKLGIKYQVIKVGKYKSATEMYTEDRMSDANREQITRYITGLWNHVSKDIAKSRNIKLDVLNGYADNLTVMMGASELKKAKLVDGLYYYDEIRTEVKKKLGLEEDESINQVTVGEMHNVKEKKASGDEVAIYYACGDIVDNAVTGLMSGDETQIVGSVVCKDLEELAENDDVKAVVLRVNSPGGSAYASEQIWHYVTKLKAKKPVVVSMGDYAASGGYYISCNASWIVAEPTTLTGSIGIFGVIPEASELFTKKLGLKFDEVKTNKHATMEAGLMGFLSKPFDAEEQELLQAYITRGYHLFRQRVADGRKQKVEHIESIAQGRVWLGEDAIGIKLVDQIGCLDDAVAKAAQLAKLDKYYTSEYPSAEDNLFSIFEQMSNKGNNLDEKMKVALGEWYVPFMAARDASNQSWIQARMPMILNVK